jgi:hypothetical protein
MEKHPLKNIDLDALHFLLFLSLLGLQAQIGPICSRALSNNLTFALKIKWLHNIFITVGVLILNLCNLHLYI